MEKFHRTKKSPVIGWMDKVESACMDKVPIRDGKQLSYMCGRNVGEKCKYENCPLKDVKHRS